MIKVAIVSPSSHSSAGGVERFVQMLSSAFADEGMAVQVFSPVGKTSYFNLKSGFAPIQQSLSLRTGIRLWGPDVVITNGTMGVLGPLGCPRIHVFHGTMPAHNLSDRPGRKVRDWLFRGTIAGGICELLSGVAAVRFAVSNTARTEVRRYYGFRDVRVISNGVRVLPDKNMARSGLIYVGRRESRKGYETAVCLALEVGERLKVAGPGYDERTVNLGVLNRGELEQLYGGATAMVFPTNYEACSFAILEALAQGCPVVTTNVGWVSGLVEYVPNYEKLVSAPGDYAGLRDSLQLVLSHSGSVDIAVQDAKVFVHQSNSEATFAEKWVSAVRERVLLSVK